MSTATISALKNEITRLEQELGRHRRALQVLEGGESRAAPAPSRPSAPTSQKPTVSAPQKPIKALVQELLKATAPQRLTPAEIVKRLSQRGHQVKLDNIHSRLSELAKAKAVNRHEGRYWLKKK